MQLSQLFRRGVVRPIDDLAVQQVAAFKVDTPIRVEWLPVMSEGKFAEIWESGVLQRINKACEIEISDYEEVELPLDKIVDALRALRCEASPIGTASIFSQNLDALLTVT